MTRDNVIERVPIIATIDEVREQVISREFLAKLDD